MPIKPFKTYSEQIRTLEDRGLTRSDRENAEHILQHFNYYRLSAYRFPFERE